MEFEFRTGKVVIDYDKCDGCKAFACVKACSLHGSNILSIRGGKPVLAVTREEAILRDNECLACEYCCEFRGGKGACKIVLPLSGLEEYRKRTGLTEGGK